MKMDRNREGKERKCSNKLWRVEQGERKGMSVRKNPRRKRRRREINIDNNFDGDIV